MEARTSRGVIVFHKRTMQFDDGAAIHIPIPAPTDFGREERSKNMSTSLGSPTLVFLTGKKTSSLSMPRHDRKHACFLYALHCLTAAYH